MRTLPFPVRDANASSGTDGLGNLPEWDLSDLYTSPDAPERCCPMPAPPLLAKKCC